MAKNSRTAPAAPAEVQQASNLPHYLETMRPIIELIRRYVTGEKAVLDQLRRDVAAARDNRDQRNNLNAAFGKLIVVGGLPMSLLDDVLDEKTAKFLGRRADHFMACAKAVGTRIEDWSYAEAKRVLDAYKIANRSSESRDVFAILSSHGSPYWALEAWVYPRPRATKEGAKVALDVERQKLEIEAKIVALEAKKAEAIKAEDFDGAKALSAEIVALRATMTNLAAPASTPVPTAVQTETPAVTAPSGSNGKTEFTLDDAVDACTADNASEDLKRLLNRRLGKSGKAIDEASFVKKVAVLVDVG